MRKAKDAPSAPPAEIIPPTTSGGKGGKAKAALAKLGLAAAEGKARDPEMEGLMAEIEADLREEELRRIWERYGWLIIAVIVVGVLAAIGVQFWRQHKADEQMALAAKYDQAVKDVTGGKPDDALPVLADVGKHAGQGYAAIADFERAALLLKKNDEDGAVAIYKAVAADSKTDQTLRDLATFLEVLHSMDRGAPQALEVTLAPLLNPGNPFNPSALELSAVLAAKEGDVARAAKLVDQILADPAAPQALRSRAENMAAYYKTLLPPAPPAPAAAAPAPSAPTPPAPPPKS